MANEESAIVTKTSIMGGRRCEWYEAEQNVKFGYVLPNQISNEDICDVLMRTDSDFRRLGATTFDYWTSTHDFEKEQRGYVQTHEGKRIIDTRLIFQIEQATRRRPKARNYELVRRGKLYEAIELTGELDGRELAYVTFIYKRLVANPTHDRKARVVNDRTVEKLIDSVVEEYRKIEGISEAIREETCAEIDVWVPDSYDMCTGTPVELHTGLFACVGTAYFEGNEFPQSLYFIIDKEKGDVIYIKTFPFGGVVHATRTDGTGVSSGPTTIDRRKIRFAGTHSKLRPGQIRAQL
jgi:hypothetical protein